MSEPTVRTPSAQAEAVPSPMPEAEQSTPEATVQAGATAAAEKAAEAEEQARTEAEQTAKAVVKAYRKGEASYRAGLLEAGRLADQYLHQRMALGDKRAAGVQRLEGLLAAWSSSTVDVHRLIGCYHAYRLLAEEPGVKADVPYGHLRDSWAQLVQRTGKDTAQETWVLLPGVEEECRATFARCVKDGLGREAVQEQAKAVVRKYADALAAQTKAAEAEAARVAAEKAAAERQAREEAVRAEKAALEAKAKVEAAQDADKARLAAEAEQAQAELLTKQQAALKAAEEKAQAERAKAKQAAEAKAAEDAQRKAAEKAAKAAQTAAERAAEKASKAKAREERPRATSAPNLLATARHGIAKDVASMAAELVTGCDCPDDVLAELLAMLKASSELSGKAKRACDAALVILHRSQTTNPVAVAAALAPASSNGTPLAAVA